MELKFRIGKRSLDLLFPREVAQQMKLIIRVRSPQLKRFLDRPRIQKLPRFKAFTDAPPQSSPFAVWAGTTATIIAFVCLAMVAGLEPGTFSGIGHVGQSLLERVTPQARPVSEAAKPPEASYPYASVPPLQSELAPVARPALTLESPGRSR